MKALFITPEDRPVGFEPVMWLRSQEMVQTLARMHVEVCPIPLPEFRRLCRAGSSALAEFKADFITAPNFNYFLVAANDEGRLPPVIDKTVVALWDDPLGALANGIRLGESRGMRGVLVRGLTKAARFDVTGVTHALRRYVERQTGEHLELFASVMRHPLLRHFSWDSGHVEAVERLGLLESRRVQWYPIATYRPFLDAGLRRKDVASGRDVAFCGNVYPNLVSESRAWRDEVLRGLTTRICEEKLRNLARSVWSIMAQEIEALPDATRAIYDLQVTRKNFWEYYLFTVWHAANTLVRLGILGGIKHDVDMFGLFADPKSSQALHPYANLRYRGNVHHFEGLPDVYASSRINVCASNGLVAQGLPSKLIDCLASGGFALTDPKDDVRRFFGPVAERIFFRDVDELNAKIDYFLAHPAEREEIVDELGDRIRRECTVEALFQRVLAGVG